MIFMSLKPMKMNNHHKLLVHNGKIQRVAPLKKLKNAWLTLWKNLQQIFEVFFEQKSFVLKSWKKWSKITYEFYSFFFGKKYEQNLWVKNFSWEKNIMQTLIKICFVRKHYRTKNDVKKIWRKKKVGLKPHKFYNMRAMTKKTKKDLTKHLKQPYGAHDKIKRQTKKQTTEKQPTENSPLKTRQTKIKLS